MSDKAYNVLFVCTGNSARSIMAEAILNKVGHGQFRAYSAGNQPKGYVHPIALEILEGHGFPVDQLSSKHCEVFAAPDAPQMDFIITVCDKAAGEVCAVWPGQPVTAHWSFEDPTAVEGDAEKQRAAFDRVFRQIAQRLHVWTCLPQERLDRISLQQRVREIGEAPIPQDNPLPDRRSS